MLSVVIGTHDSERALLPTLTALVAGAAAGLLREVIIADAGSQDATAAIADGAGCRLLTLPQGRGARLKAAAQLTRASWLLFLAPGSVPDATWVDETRRFIEQIDARGCAESFAAGFRPASAAFRPAVIDALGLLWSALAGKRDPRRGMVIAKSLYESMGGHRDVPAPELDLARRLGRRRIVLLRCGATMDERRADS
jgi:hypothetical protein